MKKIIVKGNPDLRLHEIRCGHCGCLFRYTNDEQFENNNIMGHPLSVACPWCLTEIRCPSVDSVGKETLRKCEDAIDRKEVEKSVNYESMVDEIG